MHFATRFVPGDRFHGVAENLIYTGNDNWVCHRSGGTETGKLSNFGTRTTPSGERAPVLGGTKLDVLDAEYFNSIIEGQ